MPRGWRPYHPLAHSLPGKPRSPTKRTARRVVTKPTVKISIPLCRLHLMSQLFPIPVSASCLRPPRLVYKRPTCIDRLTYETHPLRSRSRHVVRSRNCKCNYEIGNAGGADREPADSDRTVRMVSFLRRYIRDACSDDNKIPSKLRVYSRECPYESMWIESDLVRKNLRKFVLGMK